MAFKQEEINKIMEEIRNGVDAARKCGVACDYPDNFTVSQGLDSGSTEESFYVFDRQLKN